MRAGFWIILCLAGRLAQAEFVTIVATQDNTIYSEPASEATLSNGAGDFLYAGNTGPANPGDTRRALVAFDVADQVPVGAVITSVSLSLSVSRVPPGGLSPVTFTLFAVTAPWGEGTSDAGTPGGAGAAATTGDATWRHNFYDTSFWITEGGDFDSTPSATFAIGSEGVYSVESAGMVADVQAWVDDPTEDFGWIIIGDELNPQTARRFDSRDQSGNPEGFPMVTVEYAVIPEADSLQLLACGMLTVAALVRFRRAPAMD